MRRWTACLLGLGVLLACLRARADACDDKCAPAKLALLEAEKRAEKAEADAKAGAADLEAQNAEIARIEKEIADARDAKDAALKKLEKPRGRRQTKKLLQTVKDSDAVIEGGAKQLEAAKDALKKREDAKKALEEGAGRAKEEVGAARKAQDDCRTKCVEEAKAPKQTAPPPPPPEAKVGPSRSGLSLGARSGAALPFGAFQSGSAMSDQFSTMVPLQLEAGWRFSERFELGAYFQYGIVFRSAGACAGTSTCSSNDVRFGLAAEVHLTRASASVRPWLGAGAGYEIESTSATLVGGGDIGGSVEGFELGTVQGGLDLKALPRLLLGPFVSFSTGMYVHGSNGTLAGKRLHEWLTFGARGRFDAM